MIGFDPSCEIMGQLLIKALLESITREYDDKEMIIKNEFVAHYLLSFVRLRSDQ